MLLTQITKHTIEQTIELSVVWDGLVVTWRHCNGPFTDSTPLADFLFWLLPRVVRREALVVVKDIIRGVEKNDIKVMNKYTVMLAQERSREEGFNLRFAVITQTLAEVGMDRILRTVKGKYPNTDKQIKQFWHTVALSEHMIQSRAGLRRFLRHKDYMRLMMSVFCAWERELRTKNIGKFDDYYRDNTMYSAFAIMERCIYKSKPNLELGMFFCYLIQVPPVVNIYGSARWRMGNIKWRYMLHYLNIAYCCDIFVPMTEEEERRVNYIELTSFYMILCSSPQCMALTQADRVFAHCGRCMMARYCSKECQRSHWKAGHKAHCMGYDVEQKHLPIQTSLQRLLLLRWTEWYNHYCLNAKNCKDLVLTAWDDVALSSSLRCHNLWRWGVVMIPSSMWVVATQVIFMTTCAIDNKVGIMTTLGFQLSYIYRQLHFDACVCELSMASEWIIYGKCMDKLR